MNDGQSRYEDEDIVIVSSVKTSSYDMMKHAKLSIINQLLAEVLQDVPDPDFIEVRAIRFDAKIRPEQEAKDERSPQPAPDGEPPAGD